MASAEHTISLRSCVANPKSFNKCHIWQFNHFYRSYTAAKIMAAKINSISGRRALEALGKNVKTARLKRRISVKGFAERIGVSERTVIRLEKGDDGVSIGTLTMACLVLGEIERISNLLDPGSDDIGLTLDRESLPKRIRKKHNQKSDKRAGTKPSSERNNDEGVGF